MVKTVILFVLCTFLVIVKGQDANMENANPAPTQPAVAEESTHSESPASPESPPKPGPLVMFENIMTTLSERLDAMEATPQDERDRILENTRKGLDHCKSNLRSTNVRLHYRVCIDHQVQRALNRARKFELPESLPVPVVVTEKAAMNKPKLVI